MYEDDICYWFGAGLVDDMESKGPGVAAGQGSVLCFVLRDGSRACIWLTMYKRRREGA
jgi:hypothetical protein